MLQGEERELMESSWYSLASVDLFLEVTFERDEGGSGRDSSDLRRRRKKRQWGWGKKLWSEKNIGEVQGHGDGEEAEDEYESMIKCEGAHGTNHHAGR